MISLVYWLGAFLDFATTRKGLESGFREGNPVVRYVLDKLPFDSEIELMGLKIGVYVTFRLLDAPDAVFFGFGALQSLAAVLNYQKLRKASVL